MSNIKLIKALSRSANLSLNTTNLEPDNLIDVSKSIHLFLDPISACDFTLNEKSLIFPTFFINVFDFSSLPTGTSSRAMLGREKIIAFKFFWLSFCFFESKEISSEIFFDLSKFDLSFDLDNDFFSCSNNSLSFINFLFNSSNLLNFSTSKFKFLFLNFLLKLSKFFLKSFILCIF